MTIGERLKEERLRLGLSQTAAGALADVTKMSQINYEKGERMPDAAYLEAFAAAGADVLYILTGQRAQLMAAEPPAAYCAQPLAPDEAALLENYRHSPPEAQAALRATSAALAQREMKPGDKGKKHG